MISQLQKEICTVCGQDIKLGQVIGECETCGDILHGTCLKKSKFVSICDELYCQRCSRDVTNKYNPFAVTSKSDNDKFYDDEPSTYIESVHQISQILSKCQTFSAKNFNQTSSDLYPKSLFSNFF